MTEVTNTGAAWLSREEMDAARERLPILYVDAVPVRVDDHGVVTSVGLLLRIGEDGQVKRALVSGRGLVPRRGRGVAPSAARGRQRVARASGGPGGGACGRHGEALNPTWFPPADVGGPAVLA